MHTDPVYHRPLFPSLSSNEGKQPGEILFLHNRSLLPSMGDQLIFSIYGLSPAY